MSATNLQRSLVMMEDLVVDMIILRLHIVYIGVSVDLQRSFDTMKDLIADVIVLRLYIVYVGEGSWPIYFLFTNMLKFV